MTIISKNNFTRSTLEAAIQGFTAQKQHIELQIADCNKRPRAMGTRLPAGSATINHHTLSPSARKRISQAQKARWAKARKQQKPVAA